MALTPSTLLPLGSEPPAFRLPDADGKDVSIKDFAHHQGLLVACHQSPC